MKSFTLDTMIGELIQEMQEEGQGLSLQEVALTTGWDPDRPAFEGLPYQTFSVLIGKGPEVSGLMHRLMAAVKEATGAEGQRIHFRIG